MPGLFDLPQSIKLDDGESFVGLYDPMKDVDVSESEKFGTRYTFRFLNRDGRLVKITAGARLQDSLIDACSENGKPSMKALWVEITAHGRFTDDPLKRTYSVRAVPNPNAK